MWQPIETAPRDGTQVLLAGADFVASGSYVVSVSYDINGLWMDSRGPGYEWDVWGYGELTPTHWMPLPEPPLPNETTTP